MSWVDWLTSQQNVQDSTQLRFSRPQNPAVGSCDLQLPHHHSGGRLAVLEAASWGGPKESGDQLQCQVLWQRKSGGEFHENSPHVARSAGLPSGLRESSHPSYRRSDGNQSHFSRLSRLVFLFSFIQMMNLDVYFQVMSWLKNPTIATRILQKRGLSLSRNSWNILIFRQSIWLYLTPQDHIRPPTYGLMDQGLSCGPLDSSIPAGMSWYHRWSRSSCGNSSSSSTCQVTRRRSSNLQRKSWS